MGEVQLEPEAPGRWATFTPAERSILANALRGYVEDINAAAAADAIPADKRENTAGSLLVGAAMLIDLDTVAGVENVPALEVFELSAALISEGTFAQELRRMRAEGGEAA